MSEPLPFTAAELAGLRRSAVAYHPEHLNQRLLATLDHGVRPDPCPCEVCGAQEPAVGLRETQMGPRWLCDLCDPAEAERQRPSRVLKPGAVLPREPLAPCQGVTLR